MHTPNLPGHQTFDCLLPNKLLGRFKSEFASVCERPNRLIFILSQVNSVSFYFYPYILSQSCPYQGFIRPIIS